MRPIILFLLMSIGFYSYGQNNATSNQTNSSTLITDTVQLNDFLIKTAEFSNESYIHTEANYMDSTGKGIIIQNSYPRGGGYLYTPSFLNYGNAVFWSRVINKTNKTVNLTIQFPPDSILIASSPNSNFKLLVPLSTMTSDKVSTFNFGLEDISVFVKNNFYQPSELHRKILPNEESMFYVILLSHVPQDSQGVFRAGLFLKDETLFYKLTVNPVVSKLLPCGQIDFEN